MHCCPPLTSQLVCASTCPCLGAVFTLSPQHRSADSTLCEQRCHLYWTVVCACTLPSPAGTAYSDIIVSTSATAQFDYMLELLMTRRYQTLVR
jgi:hypothetical protein